MGVEPMEYVCRLIEISKRKKEYLSEILLLTTKQVSALEEAELDVLQSLLADKQKKIDEINRGDEDFSMCFTGLKRVLGIKNLDDPKVVQIEGIGELKKLTSQIMGLLGEIGEKEKQNIAKSQGLLKEFGSGVKKINEGRKASIAYSPDISNDSQAYYIDKRK